MRPAPVSRGTAIGLTIFVSTFGGALLACRSPLWVTSDKTHIEHNESALALTADMLADMHFRCDGPKSDVTQPDQVDLSAAFE